MDPEDIDWPDIMPEPFVTLLLGARGEGKTALGHRLLEVFAGEDRDAYIMGFPEAKEDLLPDWVEVLPPGTAKEQWPEDSIVLIHEAHQVLHARRSLDQENLDLDELVTVSRHKNSNIIYDTQQSQRLDKNAVASVDAICVRWPALMQEQFERRAVRPIIEDARETLREYVEVHDTDDYTYVDRVENDEGVDLLHKHVYVHADRFRGEYPGEVDLAEHYSEEISKAYGGHEDTDDSGSRYNSLQEVRNDMADIDDIDKKDADEVDSVIESATRLDSDEVDDIIPDSDDGGDDTTEQDGTTEQDDTADEEETTDSGGSNDTTPTPDDGVPRSDFEAEPGEFDSKEWYKGVPANMEIEPAYEYLERLSESGNKVLQNNHPVPTVEIIFPRDQVDVVSELVDSHLINPMGPDIISQPPSLAQQEPDVGWILAAYQFELDQNNSEELGSSGYDIGPIVRAMNDSDVPFVVTKSPAVKANIPV